MAACGKASVNKYCYLTAEPVWYKIGTLLLVIPAVLLATLPKAK